MELEKSLVYMNAGHKIGCWRGHYYWALAGRWTLDAGGTARCWTGCSTLDKTSGAGQDAGRWTRDRTHKLRTLDRTLNRSNVQHEGRWKLNWT